MSSTGLKASTQSMMFGSLPFKFLVSMLGKASFTGVVPQIALFLAKEPGLNLISFNRQHLTAQITVIYGLDLELYHS
jgi:hypothetical protein